MGDQVTLNVNVFLRSFVQAIGVLVFMFLISWEVRRTALGGAPERRNLNNPNVYCFSCRSWRSCPSPP